MEIKSLLIQNFRAIEKAELLDLPANIVVAGPNGCGKSAMFDAIRLWKSAYGGYSDNEWQQWFGEFQISLDRSQPEIRLLFRDKGKPIVIALEVALAESEKKYLMDNAVELLTPLAWSQISPNGPPTGRNRTTAVAAQIHAHGPDVGARVEALTNELENELKKDRFAGTFTIEPTLALTATPSVVLQLVYSVYSPESIGVFEYNSAQRTYQREQLSNVDLRIEVAEQQQGQHALYNAAAKYQNVKTQMAASYIRELIAKEAGVETDDRTSLVKSLQELFRLFFPDKEFLGPRATREAKLSFTVRTRSGHEHDINELSSGEKEVLYGYLRLRNLSPHNSVLLLDEPELHLNPRLVRGLAQFYRNYLGQALSNQIWLVTHSDVLLAEALDQPEFAVFHMLPASEAGGNQLVRVAMGESLDRAILDLVGDMASYRPHGTLVIFEGGGDTDFDLNLTRDLFPSMIGRVNAVSGTNKTKVRELHRLLEAANAKGALRLRVFSVVDRDNEDQGEVSPSHELTWDRYHIENYLLEPRFILEALDEALRQGNALKSPEAVEEALKEAAREGIGGVLQQEMVRWANGHLVQCLAVGASPKVEQLSRSLHTSVEESQGRVDRIVEDVLTAELIEVKRRELERELLRCVEDETWKVKLPGRDILKRFVGRHGSGMAYEILRNLVIGRMRQAGFEPPGMRAVVEQILATGGSVAAAPAPQAAARPAPRAVTSRAKRGGAG